jgi:hypothetical protein
MSFGVKGLRTGMWGRNLIKSYKKDSFKYGPNGKRDTDGLENQKLVKVNMNGGKVTRQLIVQLNDQ